LDVFPFDSFEKLPEKTDRDPRLDAIARAQTASRKEAASLPQWLTLGCECCFAEDQRNSRQQYNQLLFGINNSILNASLSQIRAISGFIPLSTLLFCSVEVDLAQIDSRSEIRRTQTLEF
jgi:hypothetical protein